MPPHAHVVQRTAKFSQKRTVDDRLWQINEESKELGRKVRAGDVVWTRSGERRWNSGTVVEIGIMKSAPNAAGDAMEMQEHLAIYYATGFYNPAVLGDLAYYGNYSADETDSDCLTNLNFALYALTVAKDHPDQHPAKVALWGYSPTLPSPTKKPRKAVAATKKPRKAVAATKKPRKAVAATKKPRKAVAAEKPTKPAAVAAVGSSGAAAAAFAEKPPRRGTRWRAVAATAGSAPPGATAVA
jgi:hypothetical protein